MTQTIIAEKPGAERPRREILKLGSGPKRATDPVSPYVAPYTGPIVMPSAPRLFPLGMLMRAQENVRHTRVDEDCEPLADDIMAHGLLQSLIGFEQDGKVEIVGGGRRLKALRIVKQRGAIDDTFPVPVLIRGIDEAVELSLAENLQQRTMSPVDEFFAFSKLMEPGTSSPADLAKRFGFSERVVKQRLRLAELAPEVLHALGEREITLDAAMAYASSQDRALQVEVFAVQKKRGHKAHQAGDVRHALRIKGIDTADRLYRFVGAPAYERDGGTYEDTLFSEAGKDRVLAKPFLLETLAHQHVDFQAIRLVEELKQDEAWAPAIAGFVKVPDLRVHAWGTSQTMRAPAGFVLVERAEADKLWRTIRNNGFPVHLVVGIDEQGQLVAWRRYAFVPIAQKTAAVQTSLVDAHASRPTPEQEAAAERERGIIRLARRLAVGPFTGTRFEGRARWPASSDDRSIYGQSDGISGFLVPVYIFVSEAEIAAQRKAAAAEYDAEASRRAEARA